MKIYTIGHSDRKEEDFLSLLKAYRISLLVDIRTIPKSRHNPQFNLDTIAKLLASNDIKYIHMKELGGLRKPKKDSVNKGWRNYSFRGFADYMQTTEFENAIQSVIELAKREKIALMCAEGNPFRCHRSLVSDALITRGVDVEHISSVRHATPHRLTPFAKVQDNRIIYT
ncbi:MAG: DUF488 domain-containing protein [Conexivisphaerales archaeon]